MTGFKISFMGKPLDPEDLPEAPATAIEDHFAKVILSPLAIDRASMFVPEEAYNCVGLHTWLSRLANEAFLKLKTDERIVKGRTLTYVFEFAAEGPVLKTVHRG